MKNILVIGAAGQIGSELVPELRRRGYMTVAAGSGRTPLTAALSEGGPTAVVNLLDADGLRRTVEHYAIDTIFNMAAILSAVGESKPMTAWDIGVNGVIGLLELARDKNLSVFTPSSIGVFGPETPHDPTPQDTVCRPRTMYGITKVAGELLSDYYRAKYGVDARSVRYPGLISHVTPPGGGTTDYAVEGSRARPLRLSARRRDEAADDVHGRCAARRHRADGGRCLKTPALQQLQRGRDELCARGRGGEHQKADARVRAHLRGESPAAGHRRELA